MPLTVRHRGALPLALALALALALLGGCAATPPAPPATLGPAPSAFRHAPAEALPVPLPAGDWWAPFGDPVLDALIARAQRDNPSIEVAAARLAQMRAALQATDAARAPQVGLSADATRQTGPLVNAAGSSGTLLRAGVTVGYEADLFGRASLASEAARRDADQSEAAARAVRLLVQTDVAQAYLRLRGIDQERALARRLVQAQADTLALVTQRFQAGSVAEVDLARARTEWLGARADLVTLDRQRMLLDHALALLLGEPASGFDLADDPGWTGHWPAVPPGIPSSVLARRPDLQAAQQALRAAEARHGLAHAADLPSLLLTVAGGQASPTLGSLLQASMRAWSLGAVLNLPLFDGGRRAAEQGRAAAEVAAQQGDYRGKVLLAFKEVDDQLAVLQGLREERALQVQVHDAAERASVLAERRYRSGLASQLDWLQARRTEARASRRLVQIDSAIGLETVGLIKALGGGWGEAPGPVAARGF